MLSVAMQNLAWRFLRLSRNMYIFFITGIERLHNIYISYIIIHYISASVVMSSDNKLEEAKGFSMSRGRNEERFCVPHPLVRLLANQHPPPTLLQSSSCSFLPSSVTQHSSLFIIYQTITTSHRLSFSTSHCIFVFSVSFRTPISLFTFSLFF